ncbi:transcription termination factor Rho [Tomitella fengzijianii]|uniref:transcription termination factor Rho n=1 Tax=Tomitella fengzijianii TaxID=2597660 RepID=UPI0035581E1E
MTDTELINTAGAAQGDSRARGRDKSAVSSMLLPELKALAVQLGIKGTSGMRKGQLLAAIQEHQAGGGNAKTTAPAGRRKAAAPAAAATETRGGEASAIVAPANNRPGETAPAGSGAADGGDRQKPESAAPEASARGERQGDRPDVTGGDKSARGRGGESGGRGEGNGRSGDDDGNRRDRGGQSRRGGRDNRGGDNRGGDNRGGDNRGGDKKGNDNRGGDKNSENQGGNSGNQGGNSGNQGGGRNRGQGDGDGGGRRGRRFRERRRGRDRGDRGGDVEVRDDDVLQPVAGIIDVLDNYAFVRTSGYLPGSNDVYVSMNMVRKNGLRRGDAITGAVRVPRDNDHQNQRQKFNPLVRLDTVNGSDVETAKARPEFSKLTPLYPNQRLRLETEPNQLTTRVIDLIMPIGKGQRALIVSPPKAGKTTVLQSIANAIATNNPECYLMVVLVDERPEEVTDMQRSVRGEVIASTFDRPPSDHTAVAELAIERAKRLVESGKDVVVLLDSITRLGRAYNNSSPASGRILSGGVDSTALYPPKRFLGAARNIEHGGSLTIIATAMVETGSQGDTVIFEEFKGTGNAELKLDRKIAERRVFPAVDINPSGTRRDDLLLAPEEAAVVHKLRRVMSGLDSQQAIDVLMEQLKKSRTNYEFLMQVSKTALGAAPE